jgi:hypothetical protein
MRRRGASILHRPKPAASSATCWPEFCGSGVGRLQAEGIRPVDNQSSPDAQDFLNAMFKGLLGRDPEPEAAAYLAAQFAGGRPFESLVEEIAQSVECRRRHQEGVASFLPAGHVLSPICDPEALAGRYHDPALAPANALIPGIRLQAERQFKLWELWRPMLESLPFPDEQTEGWRHFHQNPYLGGGDATVLHCMLRWLRPRRYVEVGPGHGAACALDTIERFLDRRVEATFLFPDLHPVRLLLRDDDQNWTTQRAVDVRDVEPEFWDSLEPGDVLFIDTGHVAKTGSDLLAILFEILPRLQSGVVVQFRHIFFPFEYPRHWVLDENRSWNELYILRAFLTGNPDWEILFFNNQFRAMAPGLIASTCPVFSWQGGGSLWLRKT